MAITLATALAAGISVARTSPAFASEGASGIAVSAFRDGEHYGDAIKLYARVWDASDSCTKVGDCNWPEGRVDFYAVQGASQTFLASGDLYISDLVGMQKATDQDIDPQLLSCCLDPGTYTIRGYFVPDPNNLDPNSADTAPLTIGKADSRTILGQSSASTAFGQEVTFSVQLVDFAIADDRAVKPTGFVSLWEGTTSYGTAALDADGNATIKTSLLPAGSHTLKAVYVGDDRYTGSDQTIDHTVAAGATASTLAVSATTTTFGDAVTLTDTVAGVAPAVGTPTGTVSFMDGSTIVGTGFLDEGGPDEASTSIDTLGAGSHTLTASYPGDDGFAGSTSNSVTVTVAKAATTTSLVSSANPSTFGQSITFTASVSGPGTTTPTGTVQFRIGGTNVGGPQAVIAGTASLTVPSLAGGTHLVSAVYSGNANLNGSTSNTVTQTVTCDRTITGASGPITVSSGSTCLSGAKVTGNITISGGSLSIANSTVTGGVTVTGGTTQASGSVSAAGSVTICGSTITGNTTVASVSGFVLIGDPRDDACAGNWLKGTVMLTGNRGGLALDDNRVGGSIVATGNVGSGPAPAHQVPEVEANTVGGYLTVANNAPAVTDEGRPNLVKGKIRWVQ